MRTTLYRHSILAPLALFFLSAVFGSCGKTKEWPSHSNLSEGDAKAVVESRKRETLRIRQEIETIRARLAPYENLLNDSLSLSNELKFARDNPLHAVRLRLSQLRYLLRDAVQELAKKPAAAPGSPDDYSSSNFSRRVPLPENLCVLENQSNCAEIYVALKSEPGQSRFYVSNHPIALENDPDQKPLATFLYQGNQIERVDFDLSEMDWFNHKLFVYRHRCLLEIPTNGKDSELTCDAQKFTARDFDFQIDQFYGRYNPGKPADLRVDIQMEFGPKGKPPLKLILNKEPGKAVVLKIGKIGK